MRFELTTHPASKRTGTGGFRYDGRMENGSG